MNFLNKLKKFISPVAKIPPVAKNVLPSKHNYTLSINYPTSASNEPRWGYNSPPHPHLEKIFNQKINDFESVLKEFLKFKDSYCDININEDIDKPHEPNLMNPWLPGLDSLALYCLMAIYKPSRYIEVGSGNSTKFARKSITDNNLSTKLTSIDPEPREEIDLICDQIIREPVETVDLRVFDELNENDVLFIDNSHRCFMNSDVTVTFLDIIPRLKPGVLVEIHDIFLPYDYPPHWKNRYYSEQYLLAVSLLAKGNQYDILLPNAFISKKPTLNILNPIFSGLKGINRGGGSFWLKIK